MSSFDDRYPFTLPRLPYDYDALGVTISADIMRLHHDKHHRAYVDKLNAAIEQHAELQQYSLRELIKTSKVVPDAIRTTVINNGGGHYNHSLFWRWMSPDGGGQPVGELEQAIVRRYGSFQAFVEEFTTKSLSVFGSGWAWLQPNMDIITTPNQDSPLSLGLDEPILGLDVWEHAYYLDYKNNRADYIAAWWNVVNWQFVAERYSQGKK